MLQEMKLSKKKMAKATYKERHDALIDKLVVLQQQAREKQLGLVVLFEGWNGSGKGSRISDVIYELDARATSVALSQPFDEKAAELFADLDTGVGNYNPFMKRFWEELGERGTITFYETGWYDLAEHALIAREHEEWKLRARKKRSNPRMPLEKFVAKSFEPREELGGMTRADMYLDSIESFERSLTDNGYLVIKFFMHITKDTQRKRLEDLYSDPATRWRVTDEELLRMSDYDALLPLYDALIARSDYEFAPWHVINGEDKREANLEIATVIVEALEAGLAAKDAKAAQPAAEVPVPAFSRFPTQTDYPRLEDVDHSLVLDRDEYKRLLKQEQKRLNKLEQEMYQQRVPLMIMYEGWDAAGKGGNIKRIAQALDARAYKIYPSPAPTKTELAHPHLWRYWTRLPKAGHVGIYDRSWYGRVLVERVEGLATPEEVARAYDEINEFERDMVDWGALLIKFWVDIDFDEQLRRFEDRQNTPEKQWKITNEDWRNRDKNPQYEVAVRDMFRLTSTTFAPWTILESNDKLYARIKALRTINEALEKRLGLED